MWFGTGLGLDRYDGASFKIYNRENGKFPGLGDGTVTSVAESGKNKIWVGASTGLFCFDKQKGLFNSVPFVNDNNTPIQNIEVEKLIQDNKNRLWVATKQGLFICNDNQAIAASSIYKEAFALNYQFIIGRATLLDNARNGIWLGTTRGLSFLDFKTGHLFSKNNNPENRLVFDSLPLQSIALDNTGNLWVSDARHLLASYHFETNQIEDIPYINNDTKWLLKDGCTGLFVDSKNRLWISSWRGKVFVREPGNSRVVLLPDASPAPFNFPVGSFFDVYEDDNTICGWVVQEV